MLVTHPTLGVVRMAVQSTSDSPAAQVQDAIALMRQYAVEDAETPEIRRDLAAAIAAYPGQPVIGAIWCWVHDRIRFQQDQTTAHPLNRELGNAPVIEVLIRPVDMSGIIRSGYHAVGDCDDFSMYAAALLLAAGIDAAYCTVAADPASPEDYSHVYVVAYAPAGSGHVMRVPVDASHGRWPGWEAENKFGRRKEWPIGGKIVWQ